MEELRRERAQVLVEARSHSRPYHRAATTSPSFLGMLLDRALEIVSWDRTELDPLRLSVQV
jgi:hypothetical protein